MDDIATHLTLFVILSAAIVLIGTFYSEPEDARALRAYPKRLVAFFLGCAALTAVMLVLEHTVASVS